MKIFFLFCCFTLSCLFLRGEENPPSEKIDYDKLSETFGHLIVKHMAQPGCEWNFSKIIKGIEDAQNGQPSPLSEEEYERAIDSLQENLFLQAAEKNLEEATAFLELNSQKKEVHAIDSYLQYQVMEEGSGTEIKEDSQPLIHYTGKLIDGTVFASSEESSSGIVLPLQQTIPGFAKGLIGMKEGGKRTLYIHPELAYGISGHLPPNSLLIFEVEIVKAESSSSEAITQTE